MGKKSRQKIEDTSSSPNQSNNAGFIWGLLNILKYHHWRFIKKRLPTKRNADKKEKDDTGAKIPLYDPKDSSHDDCQDSSNADVKKFTVEEKSKKHTSDHKSVKARIKAFIADEKTKRKGRHHRSSTYPVQPTGAQTDSSENLDPAKDNPLVETVSTGETSDVNNEKGQTFSASLNPLYRRSLEESSSSDSEERHEECSTSSQVEDKQKPLDPRVIHARELTGDVVSPSESKVFLDALTLLNMNKEFLLQVLQDPGSPLARHFHGQQTSSSKMGLTKTGSFPARVGSSLASLVLEPEEDIHKRSVTPVVETDGMQKPNEERGETTNNNSLSGSSRHLVRKSGANQVVINRFKDLKHKIRHVIKNNKDERQRIKMDAVLDKVPRKHGFSKDLITDQLKKPSTNISGKDGTGVKNLRRASSLTGSMDRYLQLYECCFNSESKNHTHDRSHIGDVVEKKGLSLPSTPKYLSRIVSSPELKSYSPTENFASGMHISGTSSLDSVNELKGEALELLANNSDSHLVTGDQLGVNLKIGRDSGDMIVEGVASQDEKDTKLAREPIAEEVSAELSISKEVDSELNQEDILLDQIEEIIMDTIPTTGAGTNSEKLKALVSAEPDDVFIDANDKDKFDYVKDVLELSGFSSDGSLAMWKSDYQPLDPSVYGDVTTGCMINDPDCSGNVEGGNCNHLLLFDLINEVLMDMYERSYHYCPTSLSCLCRIRPMPLGYHVLKEVWSNIRWFLRSKPTDGELLENVLSRDLTRVDGWMNLQFDSECIGLEVEDLIFDDLLKEVFGGQV